MEEVKNFEKVCEILDRYDRDSSKLIPILQEVQDQYRYLPEEIMAFVATSLDISPAKVYGVATFFSHFALKPKGKYVIKICDGTACHVKKSMDIFEILAKKFNLKDGNNTTANSLFTVETVSCLGACGLAPVIMINDDVHGQMTPKKTEELIDVIIKKEDALNGVE